MSELLNFFANNYIWFIVVSMILIFALIGYLVDTKTDERFIKKIEIDKELESRLSVAQATNMTISQMVSAGVPKEEIDESFVEESITDIPKENSES